MALNYTENIIHSIKKGEVTYEIQDAVAKAAIELLQSSAETEGSVAKAAADAQAAAESTAATALSTKVGNIGEGTVKAYVDDAITTLSGTIEEHSEVTAAALTDLDSRVTSLDSGAVKSVVEGSTNGTVAVDGTDVAVHGLGSAAYVNTTAFDAAGAAAAAQTAAQNYADSLATNYVQATEKGMASGVATLDSNGKVPSSQLPSYVDDVLEFANQEAFPQTGESGKIYVDLSNNTTYRWSGSQYTQIKGDLVIGTTTGTAADGGTVNTHVTDTDIHVTTSDKSAWNAKYDKPSGGIPSTDMSDAVQASLALADSAIQSHQDITGKADKVSGATNGNFAALDSNGNLTDSGAKASDFLTSHQDISGKADKDTDAVEGNFAAFDANGNPVDSGTKASDFLTSHQDITGKADKVASATSGNFAGLDSNGNLTDSGKKADDFVEGISIDNVAQTKTNGVINLPAYPTKASLSLDNVTNDAQVKRTEMGVANGVATLGNDGKVPAAQLPSYVDDVVNLVAAYVGMGVGVTAAIGDILWSDGQITSTVRPTSDSATPIGICCIASDDANTGDGKARFMSLKYLTSSTPSTNADYMRWSLNAISVPNIHSGEGYKDTDYDGTGNTAAIVATNDLYSYAPAYKCQTYATAGTSAGDWYLPATQELKAVATNRSIIESQLTALQTDYSSDCMSAISTKDYWSSTEYNDSNAYRVSLRNGFIGFDEKINGNCFVISMLATSGPTVDFSHIYSDPSKTTEISNPDVNVIYSVFDGTNITYMKWNGSAYEEVTLEKGKIYVGTNDDKTYRYTGSTVVEISASPGSTDAVAEGSTNLYFTTARAEAVATAAINALDATETQTAGADGLSLSITQVDGVITSISGGIASGTYDASGSAAAVLGTSSDASTANTVYGAKAYADAAAAAAIAAQTQSRVVEGVLELAL